VLFCASVRDGAVTTATTSSVHPSVIGVTILWRARIRARSPLALASTRPRAVVTGAADGTEVLGHRGMVWRRRATLQIIRVRCSYAQTNTTLNLEPLCDVGRAELLPVLPLPGREEGVQLRQLHHPVPGRRSGGSLGDVQPAV
jgi:hypothetical protein